MLKIAVANVFAGLKQTYYLTKAHRNPLFHNVWQIPYNYNHSRENSVISICIIDPITSTARNSIETRTGTKLPLSVLIIPTIAAPLQNAIRSQITQLPYLQGLTLAHPVTTEDQFELSLLIGADYYREVIEDHVIRGDGPTAVNPNWGTYFRGHSPTLLIHLGMYRSTDLVSDRYRS